MCHFLFLLKQRFVYLRNRKGAHGLHSPYLFHLVTVTFQQKIDAAQIKVFQTHFPGIERKNAVQFLQIWQEKMPHSPLHFPEKSLNHFAFEHELHFFQSPLDFINHLKEIQNFPQERMYFIQGIRANSKVFKMWCDLTNSPTFHVSIDLFQAGILVCRNHQQKQKFVL
jgi:hypothetical protein